MSLKAPDLDDRTFDQLVDDARRCIRERCPEWTDLSPSDPGVTLVETFAYLTETLLYRLNRLPERAYVEFLRLNGVNLRPPHPATVRVQLLRSADTRAALRVPRGLRLRPGGSGDGPEFDTVEIAEFGPGQRNVTVRAVQGPLYEGELIGHGTGRSGLTLALPRAPIAADLADLPSLQIGVEATPDEVSPGLDVRSFDGRLFALWTEVATHTSERAPTERVFVADRIEGRVLFPPAGADGGPSPGALPAEGREIRAWYRLGAAEDGNLRPGLLTRIVGGPPGLRAENLTHATGWRPQETLDGALLRGPAALRASGRVITARDYERLALDHGGVGRARAITAAS
ncbi:MAG: hypothetical protein KC620_19620, partial [Myxococcales bacterium]|nr:hypothetical protein [Myxococcales bacterium]